MQHDKEVCTPLSVVTLNVNRLNSPIKRQRDWQNRLKRKKKGASLVAQWLRICLLMQETRVRALVWEDPTCHGAAGPVSHSC